jgi:hypothetical protein
MSICRTSGDWFSSKSTAPTRPAWGDAALATPASPIGKEACAPKVPEYSVSAESQIATVVEDR